MRAGGSGWAWAGAATGSVRTPDAILGNCMGVPLGKTYEGLVRLLSHDAAARSPSLGCNLRGHRRAARNGPDADSGRPMDRRPEGPRLGEGEGPARRDRDPG